MKTVNRKGFGRVLLLLLLFISVCLVSCKPASPPQVSEPDVPDVYSSYEDTAILVNSDEEQRTLTFQNLETGRRYTLFYDGVTEFKDKYGTAMAAIQLKHASIADITFIKETKKLVSFQLSEDYFSLTDVSFEGLLKRDSRMQLLGEEYKLDDYLVIASANETIERMELHPGDVLTVYGKDHTIYSMHLDSGHGYLRLANDTYFINGWIEVGNKAITRITENMLLTVPEGSYDVLVSNEGISGTKHVTVGRNQEVTLDLGDIEHEVKYGNVLFVLNPASATLFIDGKKVETNAPVSLEYGIHQLICRADGYDTLSSYIKVGDEYASITITLTSQDKDSSDEEDSEESSSKQESSSKDSSEKESDGAVSNSEQNSEKESESSSNESSEGKESASENEPPENDSEVTTNPVGKVYIDAPEDVEVYLDGEYIGVVPVVFPKKSGTIVITLRKTGYQTRSYTLRMEASSDDVHYAFSELTKS